MANFNINLAGFCIAALFVAVWAAALVYWRFGQVEARWSASMASDHAPPPGPVAGSSGWQRGDSGLQGGEETPLHLPGNVGGIR
jgi:hypothetical protein